MPQTSGFPPQDLPSREALAIQIIVAQIGDATRRLYPVTAHRWAGGEVREALAAADVILKEVDERRTRG